MGQRPLNIQRVLSIGGLIACNMAVIHLSSKRDYIVSPYGLPERHLLLMCACLNITSGHLSGIEGGNTSIEDRSQ